MRRRLSYANVTATLALVFAMSGGALAANHYLVNSTKQISPKVLKKLVGKPGKTGATGAIGAIGVTGATGKEGSAGKDATIPVLTWQNLTLENGWTAYSGSYASTPRYTKDLSGFVHLSGTLNGAGQTSNKFTVLAAGFRPTTAHAWVIVASTNGSFDPHLVNLDIESNGSIFVYNGEAATDSFVSLEGVTFYAG
jgi:hypothetical protein